MKKVNTAVAKQSINLSQQRLTIGLDLGDRNSWNCVLDETGYNWNSERTRVGKHCGNCSAPCRAADFTQSPCLWGILSAIDFSPNDQDAHSSSAFPNTGLPPSEK